MCFKMGKFHHWSIVLLAHECRLQSLDDDIRAVVAALMAPFASVLIENWSRHYLLQWIQWLWETVSELDDLSSSTANIMDLLAALLPTVYEKKSEDDQVVVDDIGSLMKRCGPFFRHILSSVRHSVLKTVHVLFNMALKSHAHHSLDWIELFLERLFQNILLEDKPEIRDYNNELWSTLLEQLSQLSPEILSKLSINGTVHRWTVLASTEIYSQLNVRLMPISNEHFCSKPPFPPLSNSKLLHQLSISPQDRYAFLLC